MLNFAIFTAVFFVFYHTANGATYANKHGARHGVHWTKSVNKPQELPLPIGPGGGPRIEPEYTTADLPSTNFEYECPGYSVLAGIKSVRTPFEHIDDRLNSFDRDFSFKCVFFEDEDDGLLLKKKLADSDEEAEFKPGESIALDCSEKGGLISGLKSEKYLRVEKDNIDNYFDFLPTIASKNNIVKDTFLPRSLIIKDRSLEISCSSLRSIKYGAYEKSSECEVIKSVALQSINIECKQNTAISSINWNFDVGSGDRVMEVTCCPLGKKQ